MIFFIFGLDNYRSKKKLDQIVGEYQKVHKSGLNLKSLDMGKEKYEEFEKIFKTNSMFQEKKMIVLKNSFSNSDFKEKFIENINKIKKIKDIIVFYEDKDVKKNDKLFKVLKKEAHCQEFAPLEKEKLRQWIKREVEENGAEIDIRALNLLMNYTDNDLWNLSNEIIKLINYTKHISTTAVSDICNPKIETDIFKTIDAIAAKNKKIALHLIHKHIEKGDSPLYLFSMIVFQFRNLLIVKQAPSYKNIAGLHPFVARKSFFQAKSFSLEELKKIYQDLFKVDLKIKTGKIEPMAALDFFVSRI